jgi:ribonuclease HII
VVRPPRLKSGANSSLDSATVLRSPTLDREFSLLASGFNLVAGMDEVGRGALAGPVCVGVVTVTAATALPPAGLADSKELSASARQTLVPAIEQWAESWALGWASAQEVDRYRINGALRLAGQRALTALPHPPGTIILDGSYDWLTAPLDLFHLAEPVPWKVQLLVKADRYCASVAAASVLAKVARDQKMTQLATQWPGYGWEQNKGYGSAKHLNALRTQGPSQIHRQSWALPVPVAQERVRT